MTCCRKLRLNNKKVQQAVVDVDGGLELLQASGFELVFDESSPECQASAAPMPTIGTPLQNSTDKGLACSESQSRADLPIEEASLRGTTSAQSPGQRAPIAAVDAAQTEVRTCTVNISRNLVILQAESDQVKFQVALCPGVTRAQALWQVAAGVSTDACPMPLCQQVK